MTRRLLTADQLAERLGCDRRYVYRLTYERRIPFHKLGSGPKAPVRFDEADVDAFIEAYRVEAAS